MNFATVLSDAEALPWVELACQQRDHGDPIFDEVDATGARGTFGDLDIYLFCSPFARRKLDLHAFYPAAGHCALAVPHTEPDIARAMLASGEIIAGELTRDEIAAFVMVRPIVASVGLTVHRIEREYRHRTETVILILRHGLRGYRELRADDIEHAYRVIDPDGDYLRDVIGPVAHDPRRQQPIKTSEQALDLAEWLASSSRITAGDIEALLRRAPLPRQAIAEIAVHARESFEPVAG